MTLERSFGRFQNLTIYSLKNSCEEQNYSVKHALMLNLMNMAHMFLVG